jgi:glycosyltransferase involved in cell wall biosynthesis
MKSSCAVSLIVSVYNRPEVLDLVLASIERQAAGEFEVVVADDGSGPEIKSLVELWGERQGRHVRHVWQRDQGFRKTSIVNRAVGVSSGEYLVFIDGDCILHHRFMERHLARRRRGVALSGRRVMLDAALTRRLSRADVSAGRVEAPTTWWRHAAAHDLRNGFFIPGAFGWRGGFGSRYEILGCNFSLFRTDFLKVNGYDERIVGRGLEDENLRSRLLNAGLAVRCISQEALQYHCHHENAGFPHDAEAVKRWRETRETRTSFGVVQGQRPLR